MGICGTLTIIFIVLKLLNLIFWSWFLVLSPILIPILILVFMLMLTAFIEG